MEVLVLSTKSLNHGNEPPPPCPLGDDQCSGDACSFWQESTIGERMTTECVYEEQGLIKELINAVAEMAMARDIPDLELRLATVECLVERNGH
jgi:hypothetical protein